MSPDDVRKIRIQGTFDNSAGTLGHDPSDAACKASLARYAHTFLKRTRDKSFQRTIRVPDKRKSHFSPILVHRSINHSRLERRKGHLLSLCLPGLHRQPAGAGKHTQPNCFRCSFFQGHFAGEIPEIFGRYILEQASLLRCERLPIHFSLGSKIHFAPHLWISAVFGKQTKELFPPSRVGRYSPKMDNVFPKEIRRRRDSQRPEQVQGESAHFLAAADSGVQQEKRTQVGSLQALLQQEFLLQSLVEGITGHHDIPSPVEGVQDIAITGLVLCTPVLQRFRTHPIRKQHFAKVIKGQCPIPWPFVPHLKRPVNIVDEVFRRDNPAVIDFCQRRFVNRQTAPFSVFLYGFSYADILQDRFGAVHGGGRCVSIVAGHVPDKPLSRPKFFRIPTIMKKHFFQLSPVGPGKCQGFLQHSVFFTKTPCSPVPMCQ